MSENERMRGWSVNREFLLLQSGGASQRSIQPVFKSQTRHVGKVHRVSSQQGGVVGEDDGGDLQILGSNANVKDKRVDS